MEYILGIQIQQDHANKTLILLEDKYTYEILNKFNMLTCNLTSTLLEVGIQFLQLQSENLTQDELKFMENVLYKQAIGSLRCLVTCTH